MPRHHRHHRHGPHPAHGPALHPPHDPQGGPLGPPSLGHLAPLGHPGPHGPHLGPDGPPEPHGAHWTHGPHHSHGPHHPDGPHGPHAHTWFYNSERRLPLEDIGARQRAIAARLSAGTAIDLDGLPVEPPEHVHATLRHEHHGDRVLKLDLKWFDRPTALYPPHHPPHHHSVFSYEGELSVSQAGELLDTLGAQIAKGAITFDEHTVRLPAEALMVVRYERGPLGDLVLKNEVIWREEETAAVQRSIVELLA